MQLKMQLRAELRQVAKENDALKRMLDLEMAAHDTTQTEANDRRAALVKVVDGLNETQRVQQEALERQHKAFKKDKRAAQVSKK